MEVMVIKDHPVPRLCRPYRSGIQLSFYFEELRYCISQMLIISPIIRPSAESDQVKLLRYCITLYTPATSPQN